MATLEGHSQVLYRLFRVSILLSNIGDEGKPLPFPPPRFFYLHYFGKEKCIVGCINFCSDVERHHKETLFHALR